MLSHLDLLDLYKWVINKSQTWINKWRTLPDRCTAWCYFAFPWGNAKSDSMVAIKQGFGNMLWFYGHKNLYTRNWIKKLTTNTIPRGPKLLQDLRNFRPRSLQTRWTFNILMWKNRTHGRKKHCKPRATPRIVSHEPKRDSSELQRKPLFLNRKNVEQCWIFPEVANQAKFL